MESFPVYLAKSLLAEKPEIKNLINDFDAQEIADILTDAADQIEAKKVYNPIKRYTSRLVAKGYRGIAEEYRNTPNN